MNEKCVVGRSVVKASRRDGGGKTSVQHHTNGRFSFLPPRPMPVIHLRGESLLLADWQATGIHSPHRAFVYTARACIVEEVPDEPIACTSYEDQK